jgi:hypothetical protein
MKIEHPVKRGLVEKSGDECLAVSFGFRLRIQIFEPFLKPDGTEPIQLRWPPALANSVSVLSAASRFVSTHLRPAFLTLSTLARG